MANIRKAQGKKGGGYHTPKKRGRYGKASSKGGSISRGNYR